MVYNFVIMSGTQVLGLYMDKIESLIRLSNLITPLGIIIISIIRPFTFLPISFVALSIPLMHRFWMSFLLINISALISSLVVFFSSRYCYDYLNKFSKLRVDPKWLKLFEKNKFELVFVLRLSMLIHFDLLSVLAGISIISCRSFILASFIGFLPESIFFSAVSLALDKPKALLYFLPCILIYGVVVFLLRKRLKSFYK